MDKNKANVPKIRFPGFTDPWEQRKLGEISKLGSSKRVHREDYAETGVPFFRGSEISKLGSCSKLEDVLYISKEYYKELKDKYGVPQTGDILITAVGTLGNPYLISNNAPFYFKDGNLIWLSDIQINSKYLNIYLGNGIGKKRVLESAVGSNQKALTMIKLQNVQILFPSEEEQHKIGLFFQNLDDLITLHQRKLNHLQDKKKSLLQKMFPKKGEDFPELRFPGFTDPWEQRKVSEITLFHKQGFYTTEQYNENKKYYLLRGTDLTENKLLLKDTPKINATEKEYKDFKAQLGDFLIVRSGTVGTYGIVDIDIPAIFGSYLIDFRFDKSVVTNEFFGYFYQSDLFKDQLRQIIQQSANTNINAENIKSTKINLPSITEQKKIGIFFYNLDHLITLHQHKLKHLQEQKKALLQQMFV